MSALESARHWTLPVCVGCCSVLQCGAVCCTALHCVAMPRCQCLSPHVTGRYLYVWDVAVCCSVLRCVAVCCSVVQCGAVCCSVVQCGAVCCSVLQCGAVWCSVL